MNVKFVSADPVNTFRKAENVVSLIFKSTVACPDIDGVQLHHTDWEQLPHAGFGSPTSKVASTFEPVTTREVPLIIWASAKLSFGGGAA